MREQSRARRGISTTRAGALLKRQIAIHTFADLTDAASGFFEMDLVAHCGWSGAGQLLNTLSMVDVATGWVACAGLRDKRQETVFHALQRPPHLRKPRFQLLLLPQRSSRPYPRALLRRMVPIHLPSR